MPTDETKRWMAVKPRIIAAAGDLPIAWPKADFDPDGKAYLAVGRVKAEPQRVTIRTQHRQVWSLMMMLMTPLSDRQPVEVTDEQAGQIAGHFPVDLKLTYEWQAMRVTERPHVSEGFREGAWWQTPIRVRLEHLGT
ncbi:phage tail terminator-like protein [Paracoccus angustae]|uniref:Phage tail terminator-like protein n=1 Tax=Paracoccus angustae TaxID=1671480 RepID=A0ABV7TZH1_9RHOB